MVEEKEKVVLRRLLVVGLVLTVFIVTGWWTYRYFQQRWEDMIRANLAYTTTGVVRGKKRIVISKDEPYYINNLDHRISETPGTEQWRIYFEIDNFDQVPEPKRTELVIAENRRKEQFGLRFYPFFEQEKSFYERTQIGDKLAVHYKYIGDKKEIINIENLTHPRGNQSTALSSP
jgi:hypothetical protein